MRIHIVTADVQDKDRYRDYTTLPPEKYPYLPTVREDTEVKYGEFSSASWVFTVRVTGQNIAWMNLFAKASLFSRSSNALWTRTVGNT